MDKEIGKNSPCTRVFPVFISLFASQLPPFLLLTVKAFHGLAPSYISDPIRVKPVHSTYSLRSADGISLSDTEFKTLTPGDLAFAASALEHKNGKNC